MGINVCVKVVKAEAGIEGDEQSILFKGKVKLLVVNEDTKSVDTVEWTLGDIDEFSRAFDRIGKVSYAVVEKIDGVPKLWFLDKNPFEDSWREEVFYT